MYSPDARVAGLASPTLSSQLAAARSKYSRTLVFIVRLVFGRVPAHHDPRLAGRDQGWPIDVQCGDGCPASRSHANNLVPFCRPCEMFRPRFMPRIEQAHDLVAERVERRDAVAFMIVAE